MDHSLKQAIASLAAQLLVGSWFLSNIAYTHIYIYTERERERESVDSKKLEYGPVTIYAGFPSSLGFGVGGQSYSNFLASTWRVLCFGYELFCSWGL